MKFSLTKLEVLPEMFYDICIIGTGPAGSALAKTLANSKLRICVLESGDEKPSSFKEKLKEVDSEGIWIKEYSRERTYGGTSTTWSGLSAPLDSIDFKERYWVPDSGWPICLDELKPYYQLASANFRFPEWERYFDSNWLFSSNAVNGKYAWEKLEEKVFIAPAVPQHFGQEHDDVYCKANVDLYMDATVLRLEGCTETARVEKAIASNTKGRVFAFKAANFVLACGGIENPRLLLNSRFACKAGLGNDRDQVGRYFMNHPKNNYGMIKLRKPVQDLPAYFGFLSAEPRYAAYAGLRFKEDFQEENRLLNSYLRFQPVFSWSDRKSIESLVFFTKRSKLYLGYLKTIKNGKVISLRDYSETGDDTDLLNKRKSLADIAKMTGYILADLPMVTVYLKNRIFDKRSVGVTSIVLRNFMEMSPSASNRVMLGHGEDAFGMKLPRVVHLPGEADKKSISLLHKVLNDEIKKKQLGEVHGGLTSDTQPWPIDYDASHHMGATRMGSNTSSSVVNPDCRLHFSPNVFMAGSSVFPTSGNANPTYTIVALAIRLGSHLKKMFYEI